VIFGSFLPLGDHFLPVCRCPGGEQAHWP
jgi:hypothetical protein